MSEKPVVFISHSSLDKELAHELKRQIEQCFNDIEAFAATIEPGENWFEKVIKHLDKAKAFVLLITPNSVDQSHWVWFELGYFWSRHKSELENPDPEKKREVYYPINVDGVELPNPVKDLHIQAALLSDQVAMNSVFKRLGDLFGFTENEKADVAHLIQAWENTGNSRAQDKLTEEDIIVILSDYLRKDYKADRWIRYSELDKKLSLPSGSSKRLLKKVGEQGSYKVTEETENGIKFAGVVRVSKNPFYE